MANKQDAYWPSEAEVDEAETFRTIVVKAHHATDDSQLELKLGDIIFVLEQDETGWWGGHKEGDEATGWFPGSCVRAAPEATTGSTPRKLEQCPEQSPQPKQQEQLQQARLDSWRQSVEPMAPGCDKSGCARNCALETEQASPVRQSFTVASPQRPSHARNSCVNIPGTPSAAEEVGSTRDEREDLRAREEPAERLTHEIVAVEETDSEFTQLRRENVELKDRLRKVMRQSDVDSRNLSRMESDKDALEAKVQAEQQDNDELRRQYQRQLDEMRRKEDDMRQNEESKRLQIEDQLRRAAAENTKLRLSIASVAPSGAPATPVKVDRQAETSHEAPGYAYASPVIQDRSRAAASPRPTEVLGRSSSASCARLVEEEPPRGVVAQAKAAWEARSSSTPRRDMSLPRSSPTSEQRALSRASRFSREDRAAGMRPPTVPSAVRPAQAGLPTASSRVASHCAPISTDALATTEELNYGMSPLMASRKERQQSLAGPALAPQEKNTVASSMSACTEDGDHLVSVSDRVRQYQPQNHN
mmetsp:Transcript_43249/g.69977  ORF Transcript_43249/g.69977 Transcript_43249/m.69977 type:complete len:531 (+) Transcript_43249:84-1676(+)